MNLAYALNSAFWSLVGAGGGYYVGRLRRDVSRIQERVDDVEDDTDQTGPTRRRRRHRGLVGRLEENSPTVGVIVVIMALATVALVVYQKVQLDRVTSCYIAALKARDKDTNDSRQYGINYTASTEKMIDNLLAISPPPNTPPGQQTPQQREAVIQAITDWKDDNHTYRLALQKAQANAKQNPLFATTCG